MTDTVDVVTTKHDIGIVTAARLIAICWAGLIPVVFPAWLIVQSEMTALNVEQDKAIAQVYITRQEFEDRMKLLDERAQRNSETLKEIRDEEKGQRALLESLGRARR